MVLDSLQVVVDVFEVVVDGFRWFLVLVVTTDTLNISIHTTTLSS